MPVNGEVLVSAKGLVTAKALLIASQGTSEPRVSWYRKSV